jgi:hypothetical protein
MASLTCALVLVVALDGSSVIYSGLRFVGAVEMSDEGRCLEEFISEFTFGSTDGLL